MNHISLLAPHPSYFNRRVLLLEAGPNHTSAETPDSIRGKSLFAAVREPGRVWPALAAVCVDGQAPTPYLRGRGVGGSSAVNAQLAIRGLPCDYERWATQGCNGWGWDGVRAAFERVAERIPAERRPEPEWSTFDRHLLSACVDRGHRRCNSYETEGVLGIAPAGLTRCGGRRVSTNDAYLGLFAHRREKEQFKILMPFSLWFSESYRAPSVHAPGRVWTVSQNAPVAKVSSFAKAARVRVCAAFPVAKDRRRIDDFCAIICNASETGKATSPAAVSKRNVSEPQLVASFQPSITGAD
jgi:choline dehydrogenase-like flavoprotein